ncbi:MAG: GNAT family N-acetyltransferase [Bacteroidia bacterium]|nr:GNAT family N-acetyltransferase [Bacteroidia bacterium]
MEERNQNFEIRLATEDDAQRISELIQSNIDNHEDKSYSKEQIRAWKVINSTSSIINALNQRIIFCAFDHDSMLGTIGLAENKIVGLYVSNTKRKSGIGAVLMKYVERYASKRNFEKITLISVPSAVPFYLKQGYQIIQEVITVVEGVEYPEIEMIKYIDAVA